jgi:hypothetical protein
MVTALWPPCVVFRVTCRSDYCLLHTSGCSKGVLGEVMVTPTVGANVTWQVNGGIVLHEDSVSACVAHGECKMVCVEVCCSELLEHCCAWMLKGTRGVSGCALLGSMKQW